MTRHVDRPGIVLANAKHLESNAGANAPGATFRHEITPAGESGFSEFDESLFTLCGLKGADVVADATVFFNAIHPDDVANFEHALAPDDDDTGNRRFEIRILGPDGEARWFHGLCWPQRRVAGAAVRDGLLVDVTDRKRQETRERAIIEAMPIPAAISRVRDGYLYYANDMYRTFVGMQEGDPERSTLMNYVDLAEREKMLEELYKHGLYTDFELRVKKPDGTIMVAVVSARLMEFDGEEAIFGSLYDITDTKRAEQEIKASERRLQDFAEAASDWFWETDAEHRYTSLYMGGGAFPGDEEDFIGRKRLDVLEPYLQADDPDKWEVHKNVIADRQPFRDLTYDIGHPDGRVSTIRTSGMPVFDTAGAFVGYRGTGADITDEVEVERGAATARERLAAAIDGLSNWVAMYDADDRLVQANKAWWRAHRVAGVEPHYGMHYADYLRMLTDGETFPAAAGRDEAWIEERIRKRAAAGEPYELLAANGTWLLVADSRLPDGGLITTFTDNSQTKRTERELRESEARFRSLIEQTNQGVLVHRDDTMHFANQAIADILGYDSPEELLAQTTIDSFTHPSDRERLRDYRRARLRGEPAPFEVDVRVVRKDGQDGWLIARPTIIDWDGEPAILAAILDVSERHRAEQALRASERRFQDFSEAGSDWFWETGPDHRFTMVWGGGGASTNIEAQNIIGMTRWEVVGADVIAADPEKWAEHQAAMEGRKPFRDFVYHSRLPMSEPIWLRVNGVPVFEDDGTFCGFRGTGSDVTADVNIQLALAEAESRFRSVFDQAAVGIGVMTPRGRFIAVNRKLCELMKRDEDALLDLRFGDIVDPEDYRSSAKKVRRLLAREISTFTSQLRCEIGSGDVSWINLTVSLIGERQGNRPALLGIVEDITQRTRAEEELRQAQKMEAVGQLTGGIAHDFNNLLAIIIGNLDMIEAGTLDEETQGFAMKQVLQAAERSADLTRRLLAFSRRQALRPEPTDVNQLVAGMIGLLQRTIGERVKIGVMFGEQMPSARVDPGQLESAILNLAINGRDAMPNGGELMIETGLVTLTEASSAQGEAVLAGDYVTLSISDTGRGIESDVLGKVFEPFFTTKDVGHGSGLGLSMVYGFAKQSEGDVDIASTVGEGTTVRLYLPVAHGPSGRADAEDGARADPRGDGEVVLVVEDDDGVRKLMITVLNDLGYTPIVTESGESGLAILSSRDDCDLLLTDLVLPGAIDGVELANEARQTKPGLKIILMSGHSNRIASEEGVLGEDTVLIAKPFRRTDLARALHHALHRDDTT